MAEPTNITPADVTTSETGIPTSIHRDNNSKDFKRDFVEFGKYQNCLTIDIKDPLQRSRDATLSIPTSTDGRRKRHRLQVT